MADPVPPSIPPQVRAALERGNLIEAIKLMRQQMPQLGLAEAKALIEALQKQGVKVNVQTHVKTTVGKSPGATVMHHEHAPMPTGLPHGTPGLSPGEVPRMSPSAGLVGAIIAVVAVIAAAIYFSR